MFSSELSEYLKLMSLLTPWRMGSLHLWEMQPPLVSSINASEYTSAKTGKNE